MPFSRCAVLVALAAASGLLTSGAAAAPLASSGEFAYRFSVISGDLQSGFDNFFNPNRQISYDLLNRSLNSQTSNFNETTGDGSRAQMDAAFTSTSASNTLRFDFALTHDETSLPNPFLPSTASIEAFLNLTVTEPVRYSLSGGFLGSATNGGDEFFFRSEFKLFPGPPQTTIYNALDGEFGESFDIDFRQAQGLASTGLADGIIQPGDYSLNWDVVLRDSSVLNKTSFVGDGAGLGFFQIVFETLEVPAPGMLGLVFSGFGGLILFRRRSRKDF